MLPRRLLALAAAVLLACLLAACGSDDSDDGSRGVSAAEQGSTSFPVQVQSARGTTTIPKAPQRIVTVGLRDQDTLLGLGIKAVGAMDWFQQDTFATWPWEDWGDAKPAIVSNGGFDINFEKVAEARPDLILGVYQEIDAPTFKKLSAIAPTVAQSAKYPPYQMPWQAEARTIGEAVGKKPEAEARIKAIEGKFAQARQDHPEFAKQTAAIIDATEDGKYFAFSYDDARGAFLRQLGYKPAPAVVSATKGTFGKYISSERLDTLDVDRLFLLVDEKNKANHYDNPLFKRLAVVKEGRTVNLPYYDKPNQGAAIAFNSILSLPYAINGTLQLIADADRAREQG